MATGSTIVENALGRLQAVLDTDLAGLEDCFTEDFRFESRRQISRGSGNRDRWVKSIRTSADVFGRSEQMQTIAVRGDYLILNTSTSDSAGFEVGMLNVNEANADGRISRLVFFDDDQMDEAVSVLDGWYEASLEPHLATAFRCARLSVASINDPGLESAFAATFADDLVVDDHRAMSFGDLDKKGQVARIAAGRELFPDGLVIKRFEVVEATEVGCVVRILAGVLGDGEIDLPRLNLFLVDGDLVTRFDYFEPDAVAEAIERLHQLST